MESEGIEPSFSPCKGLVLPLDDDPIAGEKRDSNPRSSKPQSDVLINYTIPTIYPLMEHIVKRPERSCQNELKILLLLIHDFSKW